MTISIRELEWAAGFLEGDGCFTYGTSPTVSVTQVVEWPVKKLQRLFGGGLSARRIEGRSNLYNQWSIHGRRAIGVMLTLYTLMSPKHQDRIKTQIARWKAAPGSGWRKGNKRGPRSKL